MALYAGHGRLPETSPTAHALFVVGHTACGQYLNLNSGERQMGNKVHFTNFIVKMGEETLKFTMSLV